MQDLASKGRPLAGLRPSIVVAIKFRIKLTTYMYRYLHIHTRLKCSGSSGDESGFLDGSCIFQIFVAGTKYVISVEGEL